MKTVGRICTDMYGILFYGSQLYTSNCVFVHGLFPGNCTDASLNCACGWCWICTAIIGIRDVVSIHRQLGAFGRTFCWICCRECRIYRAAIIASGYTTLQSTIQQDETGRRCARTNSVSASPTFVR